MTYSADQVINGLMKYADSEIIGKLPTSGKWIMGTAMGLIRNRVNAIVETLAENTIVQMLGIVDDEGNIDAETLITAIKTAADKYGNVTLDVPMIGSFTFSSADMDVIRQYIK